MFGALASSAAARLHRLARGRVAASSTSARASRPLSSVHVPELDGIRTVAIWAVMLMHGFVAFPDYQAGVLPVWLAPIQFGWLGVDLFFVLSGFLITGILLDTRERPHYFRNFYGRRMLRIMPLYFAFVAVAAWFYAAYAAFFGLSAVFLANYAPAFGVAEPHGPDVLWSLAIEEQFYLLWPLIVLWAGRRRVAWVALAIVVFTPILRGVFRAAGTDPREIYLYSWFRFDGLALGAFLAAWVRAAHASRTRCLMLAAVLVMTAVVVTVAAIPFGVLTTNSVASGTLRFTQVSLLFGGALLAAFAWRGSRLTALLRSRFARVSAELSFCLYLVHVCILDGWWWIETRFGLRPPEAGYVEWAAVRTAIVIVISFGIAVLSRRFLERPVLRLKRYFA